MNTNIVQNEYKKTLARFHKNSFKSKIKWNGWRQIMVTFFKSQRDLAEALIKLIDHYWNNEIKEEYFINIIFEIVTKNTEKFYSQKGYSSIVQQRLGKRRIELLNKILKQTGDK